MFQTASVLLSAVNVTMFTLFWDRAKTDNDRNVARIATGIPMELDGNFGNLPPLDAFW